MPKKKKKTARKKDKDTEVVGYYWDGFKSWILTKKRWILSI